MQFPDRLLWMSQKLTRFLPLSSVKSVSCEFKSFLSLQRSDNNCHRCALLFKVFNIWAICTSFHISANSAVFIHWNPWLLDPRTSEKSINHTNTNKGSVVKQSGTDVKGFQFFWWFSFPCVRVIMKTSVKAASHDPIFPQIQRSYWRESTFLLSWNNARKVKAMFGMLGEK